MKKGEPRALNLQQSPKSSRELTLNPFQSRKNVLVRVAWERIVPKLGNSFGNMWLVGYKCVECYNRWGIVTSWRGPTSKVGNGLYQLPMLIRANVSFAKWALGPVGFPLTTLDTEYWVKGMPSELGNLRITLMSAYGNSPIHKMKI